MSRVVAIDGAALTPAPEAVLRDEAAPSDGAVSPRTQALLDEAFAIFQETVKPAALLQEVTAAEFAAVFRGEGKNADDAPLGRIFPSADALALFALTLGASLSERTEALFKENDYALGYMLDRVASLAADRAVHLLEETFLQELFTGGIASGDTDIRVLSYSPGYCGWDLSGQKRLFEILRPETIGITLNESFLMVPLKSVTGVLAAGSEEAHRFDPEYPFCRFCRSRSCLERMQGKEIPAGRRGADTKGR
jgi:hypothetical protein